MTSAQHAVPTLLLVLIAKYLQLENSIMLIIFLGVLIDIDHFSIRRIKKIMRGGKGPVEGWTNYLHTWQFFVIVCVISAFWRNLFIVIIYGIHILLDAGVKDNEYQKDSPFPVWLYKFVPQWLRYEQKGMFF